MTSTDPDDLRTEALAPAAEPVQPASDVASDVASDAASDAPDASDTLDAAREVLERLRARVLAQVLGRDEVVDLVLIALLADGHVLLEDFPGSGKTTLAKALGEAIVENDATSPIAAFRRIQFTPDLLPSDVTGVSVFDATSGRFEFHRGPIFAHVVLADEINRTSPKVQAAMLEAMGEKQVTVDNVTHPLDGLFFVIATQNPLDLAGTYPLPVAQLDRFLFKIRMDHIDRASELAVLESFQARRDRERPDLPRVRHEDVLAARSAIDRGVAIHGAIQECLVDVAGALRSDERVLQGNSTRSLVVALPALQAHALLRGRDFVSDEDVRALLPFVLAHRIELVPGVADPGEVIREAMLAPLDRLAASTLTRAGGRSR